MRILFASSEAYPLIKTGGLADVSASLPRALLELQHDIRLVIPAYRSVVATVRHTSRPIARLDVRGDAVTILETELPGTRLRVWLVDCPARFDRDGNPYQDREQRDWPDNAARFLLFCRAVVELAQNRAGLGWAPELVHCNDWQTGMIPALLTLEAQRPATIFTVHNLAYQGLFPAATLAEQGLPGEFWDYRSLEFHGRLSFIKGGLVYADRINTVSPTYAREIQTDELGCGLGGLLRHRLGALSGILNGIDVDEWNPACDPHLVQGFDSERLEAKAINKTALRKQLGLGSAGEPPLLGLVGRLVEQKGIDLLLDCLEEIAQVAQVAVLGSGERRFERALQQFSAARPDAVAVRIGYDEQLAHRIEAGADIFLMPSRFEPCGLNQLYSLRYGTLPVVHAVGGLADTVFDADEHGGARGNGFSFDRAQPQALRDALLRALAAYRNPARWHGLQLNAMRRDSSWRGSAQRYQQLYADALREPYGARQLSA